MASSAIADASSRPAYRDFGFDQFDQPPTAAAGAVDSAAASAASGAAPSAATGSKDALLTYIDRGVVGKWTCLSGPWGWRRIVYADWTASGKPLSFIERYLAEEVQPFYANTHTTSTATGLQSSLFRREARDIVKRCLRGSKDDALLFCGSGATRALNTLVHMLALPARARAHAEAGHSGPSLVVLLGPYEHHSNVLPWREAGARCIWVQEAAAGGVDMADLEAKAAEAQRLYPHALRIGAFSAASNVSGILVDTNGVTRRLHQAGFLSFWDYAAAAPYVECDANPGGNDPILAKDAVILSPHKLVGGPGSPGVLLVKKALCNNRLPSTPGGGTVFFVTESGHRYLENIEEREEGGTQDILGSVRAGLAFQLKEAVGIRAIAAREERYAALALARVAAQPNLVLIGHPSAPRLSIVSFLVRFAAPTPTPLFLHPVFVSALLNDLFGVQTRAGCLCAGPYAQRVLGIGALAAAQFEAALVEKHEMLRPGFTRLNLSWFVSPEEAEYILDAVGFVAEHGHLFLPLYGFTADSGEWKHRARMRKSLVGRRWLGTVDYAGGSMAYEGGLATKVERKEDDSDDAFTRYLSEARELAKQLASPSAHSATVDQGALLPPDVQHLRWFVLPSEAADWIRDPASCRAKWAAQAAASPAAVSAVQPLRYLAEGPATSAELSAASVSAAAAAQVATPTATEIAHASAFSLLAPTTSSQPDVTVPAAFVKPTPATAASQQGKQANNAGQKRGAEGGQQQQQQQQKSKKQRKAEAAAASAVSNTTDANGDSTMQSADGSASASAAPAARPGNAGVQGEDFRDDVCKNCWHVHWNAQSAPSASAAGAGAGGAPSTTSSSDLAKQESQLFTKECTHCECIHFAPRARRSPKEVARTASKIQKSVGAAVRDFAMIKDGDRVLIGISGGKDSLTLFHILRNLQRKAPIQFDIGCVTVDPQTPEYDPSPLKKYFAALGVPYYYRSEPILAAAKASMDAKKQSICSFCARMKRGIIYSCMRQEGYNVLALGQHLDDLAESLLMSVFHNGMLRTMKANYHAEAGDLRIIRPLIYVRERLTREYATVADLPVINENCPACFEAPKERQRVKLLLASQEHVHANLFSNMLKAMRPLLGMENTRLKGGEGAAAAAGGAAADDDDEEGSTVVGHDAQLLRALQAVGEKGAKGGAVAMDEDDADYKALDALCKAPGGACALPEKKGTRGQGKEKKQTDAVAPAADAPAAAATDKDASL